MKFLTLNRDKIKRIFGVIRFSQQTEMITLIKNLMSESDKYLPNKQEIKMLSSVFSWELPNIQTWLDYIDFSFLKSSFTSPKFNGHVLLALKPDHLCYLGLPTNKINQFICSLRHLQAAIHAEDINIIQSVLNDSRKISIPNLFDNAVDDWLCTMNITSKTNSPGVLQEHSDSVLNSPSTSKCSKLLGTFEVKTDSIRGLLVRRRGSSSMCILLSFSPFLLLVFLTFLFL